MKIDYGLIRRFSRENGELTLYAPNGKVVFLKDGTADVYSIVEEATRFVFKEKQYSRKEFEELLSKIYESK